MFVPNRHLSRFNKKNFSDGGKNFKHCDHERNVWSCFTLDISLLPSILQRYDKRTCWKFHFLFLNHTVNTFLKMVLNGATVGFMAVCNIYIFISLPRLFASWWRSSISGVIVSSYFPSQSSALSPPLSYLADSETDTGNRAAILCL